MSTTLTRQRPSRPRNGSTLDEGFFSASRPSGTLGVVIGNKVQTSSATPSDRGLGGLLPLWRSIPHLFDHRHVTPRSKASDYRSK